MAPPRTELAEAVEALLAADPARILSLASALRGTNRVVESTIAGMSMGRELPPGSRIRMELSDRERYDAGEVIAFLAGRQVIVHRVVHRGRAGAAAGYVLTRGDAAFVPDRPLPRLRILGPVTAVWKEDGWSELGGAGRRSVRGRIFAKLVLWVAMTALYLSPRAATSMLTLFHRVERRLRLALPWGSAPAGTRL